MKETLSAGGWAVLFFFALFVSWQVQASDGRAVGILQEGYKACKTAHIKRRTHLEEARNSYNSYLELKQQALEIDPDMGQGDDLGVRRILEYCEKIGADISRTEAMPVFQQGVEQCDLASQYLQKNDINKAKEAYQKYLQHTGEAVEISQTIFTVYSALSDVLRCGRVFNDIQLAEIQLAQETKLAAEATRKANEKQRRGVLQFSATEKQLQGVLSFCKQQFTGDNLHRGPQYFKAGLEEITVRLSAMRTLTDQKITGFSSRQAQVIVKLRADIDDCMNLTQAMITMKRGPAVAEQ